MNHNGNLIKWNNNAVHTCICVIFRKSTKFHRTYSGQKSCTHSTRFWQSSLWKVNNTIRFIWGFLLFLIFLSHTFYRLTGSLSSIRMNKNILLKTVWPYRKKILFNRINRQIFSAMRTAYCDFPYAIYNKSCRIVHSPFNHRCSY